MEMEIGGSLSLGLGLGPATRLLGPKGPGVGEEKTASVVRRGGSLLTPAAMGRVTSEWSWSRGSGALRVGANGGW